jgi:hypothetical protein
MSATGRSEVRDPADFYATPAWAVRRLLDRVPLPAGLWLEPCAGEGAIIRAVADVRRDVLFHAVECREECIPTLDRILHCQVAVRGSFLHVPVDPRYAAVLTNPPYRAALAFVQRALKFAPVAAFLLRLNWLAGRTRNPWLGSHMPDVFVLPDRPSFVDGGTDATDYAWMIWRREARAYGRVEVLDTTPAEERRGSPGRERGQQDLFARTA